MLMRSRTLRKEIQKAADYMAVGEKKEVERILENLLRRFADKKYLYNDAVNIYMIGKMFDEAKAVFHLYKDKFGEDLHSDFTLADVAEEQNRYIDATKGYERASVKVFKRMSAFERGRLSNLPVIIPVKEIRLSQDEIILRKGRREYRYGWSDIQDAFITSRAGHKGARFAEDVIRTLNLKTPDRTFKIDVSSKYPDFKHNEILLKELTKRLTLREEKNMGNKSGRESFVG